MIDKPADRAERSVIGQIKNSTIITGDHVTVTSERVPEPAIRVRRPWRRSAVERLLFGLRIVPVVDRPLTWLRPDAGVVPVQPRPEVDELLRWCVDEGVGRVRLVCGRGGQGKTTVARLMIDAVAQRG